MRNYNYIVYLDGMVFDSVKAPNAKTAKRRACKLVRHDDQVMSLRYKDVASVVTVETAGNFARRSL